MQIEVFGSNSSGNSYLLTDGDSALLLEAGISPKKMKADWSKVDGLLVSHEHGDHAKFIKDVLQRSGFNAYMSQGTAQFVNAPSYRIGEVKAKQAFNIGQWKVMPFEIEHDAAEPLGFLIESPNGYKVLFATDTYFVRYKFKGVTHMLIECNYSLNRLQENLEAGRIDKNRYRRLLTSHFELNNVIQFLKSNDLSDLEEIHLLHLSDSNADAELFKIKIQGVAGVPTYIAGGD